jgi:cation transport regulator ChaC
LSLAVVDADENDKAAASSATYKDDIRQERKVTTTSGRAIGYQRCWCHRSADHRGMPKFNGIVCTLLSDKEVNDLHRGENGHTSMTEGDDLHCG